MRNNNRFSLLFGAFSLLASPIFSQVKVNFDDMSYWQTSEKPNWQVAKKAVVDINKNNALTAEAGKGILVNTPTKENRDNLQSKAEYGDVDVAFEFMMARHSNSGFYLQGRYEVQLLDSWGVAKPKTGDCGGIYKRRRWTADSTEILWEGHAPRVNACIAPGLWQKMEISFQAPRFDASGKKTANAKMLRIALNGVVLHENVELTGPTGGPISEEEAARGPFMIQGDHGPVAFRNMIVKDLSGEPTALKSANFKYFKGKFKSKEEVLAAKPDLTGSFDKINWQLSELTNEFAEVINGVLSVKKAGKYRFKMQSAGSCELMVNDKVVMPYALTYTWSPRNMEVELPAGDVPFQIVLSKVEGFIEPILGLWVESNSHRPVALHDFTSLTIRTPVDPIQLDAKEPTVFRSFMDITEGGKRKRLSHAVSVGHPLGVHYTYNMNNGALAQIWKGEFLNATPMWDNRGDGSSQPRGAVLILGDTSAIYTEGVSQNQFRSLGYDLDKAKLPIFRYKINGVDVEDQIRVSEDRQSVSRILTVKKDESAKPSFARLATNKTITKVGDDLYLIGDNGFFIKTLDGKIEQQGDKMALVAPLAGGKVSYSILW